MHCWAGWQLCLQPDVFAGAQWERLGLTEGTEPSCFFLTIVHRDERINAINDPSRHQKVLAGHEAGTRCDGIHHAGATASEKTGGGDLGMLSEGNAWAHRSHWEPAVRTDRDPAAGQDAFGSQLRICVRSPGAAGRACGSPGHIFPGQRRSGNTAPAHPLPWPNG